MKEQRSTTWTVFEAQAPGRAEPRQQATLLTEFPHGAQLDGEYHVDPETDVEWLRVETGGQTVYVPRWAINRVHPANLVDGNIVYGKEVVDRWWGLPIDYEPDDLVVMEKRYCDSDNKEYPLRAEARAVLVEMLEAALLEGVDIRVCSAYRSGEYQKGLYSRAIARDGASQRYSAPPGHSEHQLGTCVDLCDAQEEYVLTDSFKETPQSAWLEKYAGRYGFRRSYCPHNVEETGYISEPWHWRYWGKES